MDIRCPGAIIVQTLQLEILQGALVAFLPPRDSKWSVLLSKRSAFCSGHGLRAQMSLGAHGTQP